MEAPRFVKTLKNVGKMCIFENVAFFVLIRFSPPFWSILDASGAVLGRPGSLWGTKMASKVAQEAPKRRSEMRYVIGKAILTKMWLSLEPQRDFWEPVLIRNRKRDRLKRSYVDLIEITFTKTFFSWRPRASKRFQLK